METAADRAFRSTSERLMGDAADAGDVAFGGEVQIESQVCSEGNPLLSVLYCAHAQGAS